MNDLVPVLATIVVIATLATLILGLFSYMAFRAREKRKPVEQAAEPTARHRFLVRLTLADGGDAPAS